MADADRSRSDSACCKVAAYGPKYPITHNNGRGWLLCDHRHATPDGARQPNVVALSPRNYFDFHDPRQPGLLSVFGHGRNDTIIVAVKVLRTSSECQHELLTGHKRHRVLSACAMDVTAEPDLRRSEGPGR